MNDSLIINARQHLRWQHRLASDTSTAVLWGWWLWLSRPALHVFGWLGTLSTSFNPTMMKLFASGSPEAIGGTAAALVGTSSTLMLWNLLPSQARPTSRPQTARDYAAHFGLSEAQVLTGQSAAVCVVHHGDNGQIIRIEARA